MNLKDYIVLLQKKLEEVGDVKVAMTQAGYYSDGIFAELHENPEVESIKIAGGWAWVGREQVNYPEVYEDFLVLGHSSQNY